MALVVHVGDALMDSAVEMIGVGEGLVSEEMALEVTPGSLDVVQFRGIFRQPYDLEPGPRRQGGPRSRAGMDRAIIEDEDDGFLVTARARPVDRVALAAKYPAPMPHAVRLRAKRRCNPIAGPTV